MEGPGGPGGSQRPSPVRSRGRGYISKVGVIVFVFGQFCLRSQLMLDGSQWLRNYYCCRGFIYVSSQLQRWNVVLLVYSPEGQEGWGD